MLLTKTKLERAQKRASSTASDDTEKEIRVKRPALASCVLFCERVSPTTALREEMTMKVNDRLNECARNLSDMKTTSESTDTVIFKLADLVPLYKQRPQQLGVESPYVNSTSLKEQLLSRIPELEAHKFRTRSTDCIQKGR